jgi:hypothetical protein
LTQFAATPDGYTPMPVAGANVKVIDVVNRLRVFPGAEMPEGWPVSVKTTPVDPSLYSSRTTRLQIYQMLAAQLGDEVAKVFYKHEIKELGENLR